MDISLVIPLKDEAESLPELCTWITKVMQEHNFTYEVFLVDDGSKDNSWEVIQALSTQNEAIKGISLNRNYGKSAALNTGFQYVKGAVVITMDADLQDSPDEIPELYRLITVEKYDLISGWKKERHDPIMKTIPTKLFNYITRLFSGIRLHDFNCGLKAYRLKVVKNIEVYGEMHRYIPVIAKWAGFERIGEKIVKHQARKYGKTKFGLERFMYGFLDLLSITFVTRFRKRPMHFFGSMGILFFLVGFGLTAWLTYDKMTNIYHAIKGREITAQPLFYLALIVMIMGSQFFLAGFLGEMITTNAHKANEYVIADSVNC